MTAQSETPKRGKDGHVPKYIAEAVQMLNNPHEHEEVFGSNLDYDRRRNDPARRIKAHAEWLQFEETWVLYVEWDDSEPLTARFIVHKAIRECGLRFYIASGSSTNFDDLDEDGEKQYKFPGGSKTPVSYLKVTL